MLKSEQIVWHLHYLKNTMHMVWKWRNHIQIVQCCTLSGTINLVAALKAQNIIRSILSYCILWHCMEKATTKHYLLKVNYLSLIGVQLCCDWVGDCEGRWLRFNYHSHVPYFLRSQGQSARTTQINPPAADRLKGLTQGLSSARTWTPDLLVNNLEL